MEVVALPNIIGVQSSPKIDVEYSPTSKGESFCRQPQSLNLVQVSVIFKVSHRNIE